MARKQHVITIKCSVSGCNECVHYSYDTVRDYKNSFNRTWTCIRHTNPETILSLTNLKTSEELLCKVLYTSFDPNKVLGKFWQGSKKRGTDKCDSGFQYGNGYKAYAEDFPEGTVIKITTEVILPNS